MQTSPTSTAHELHEIFDRQMRLCDLLEAIADSLPGRLDRQQCLHVARMIGPLIRQAHEAEERFLFPGVAALPGEGVGIIEKLRLEHIEDECFAVYTTLGKQSELGNLC